MELIFNEICYRVNGVFVTLPCPNGDYYDMQRSEYINFGYSLEQLNLPDGKYEIKITVKQLEKGL